MSKEHKYHLVTTWTGNTGQGTTNYRAYERSLTVSTENKVDILCSSDTAFNGDKTKHCPEDLLLAAISSCHMLWYLHLCSQAGITVLDYTDHAVGTMFENSDGGGHFTEVILSPVITLKDESMTTKAGVLHHKAGKLCYIANSCNFPIMHKPTFKTQGA